MNIEEIKARAEAALGMLEMKCGNCRHFPEGMRPGECHDCYPESELEPVHTWESAIPGIDIECAAFRFRWGKAFAEDVPALIAEVELRDRKLAIIRTAARHVVEAYEGGSWTRDDDDHLIEISGGEAIGSEDIRALAEAIKE